jgi:hypothetical protein
VGILEENVPGEQHPFFGDVDHGVAEGVGWTHLPELDPLVAHAQGEAAFEDPVR